ncbi:MAG: hypothetical protein LUC93_17825 [Planctomycetaceae bacterium]|nr:hypothetical protein [Planctomycetaceae bacterium]
MGVGGISGANDAMMQMMQILMQGMAEQTELCENMVAVSIENSMIGQKMATAQQIIDVYA